MTVIGTSAKYFASCEKASICPRERKNLSKLRAVLSTGSPLNPGGVRIGTSEIYRQVESIEEIVDSVVVGKNTPDADVDICLFVVLRLGVTLDETLTKKIKTRIAEGTTMSRGAQNGR